jgi:putative N6-adenine-specific DNA methylase
VGETSVPPADGAAAVVILNPEYGERMGSAEEAETMHKRIGDFFKQRCSGYTGYIFTGNLGAAKKVGLKATRRVEFYNADIDCRLLEYELYEGTKRFPSPSQSSSEGDAGES